MAKRKPKDEKPTPEKPKKPTLGRPYHFRLPLDVEKEWDAKIAASGLSESEFFRQAVIENKTVIQGAAPDRKRRAVRMKDTVPKDVKRAVFLLAQLGNNMNQLAHRLNLDAKAGKVTPATYAAILEELQGIAAIVKGWA